jgi:hypothetical protein
VVGDLSPMFCLGPLSYVVLLLLHGHQSEHNARLTGC